MLRIILYTQLLLLMVSNVPAWSTKTLILSFSGSTPYEDMLEGIEPAHRVLMLPESKITQEEYERRRGSYLRIIRVSEYLNSAEVELTALELHADFPFERIVVTDEYDLLRAAQLRCLLGLPGQNYESAEAYRDKVIMKTRVQEVVRVPKFAPLKSGCDLFKFCQEHPLPTVFKPRRGAGALQTKILRAPEDIKDVLVAKKVFNDFHEASYEAEEYITGTFYHVNGLVADQKVVACWPSIYLRAPGEITEADYSVFGSYLLEPVHPLVERLVIFTNQVLESLPTPKNTAFHLEVFHTPDDQLVFCEIASRVGGGGTNEAWKNAFSIDLEREFVRLQAGFPISEETMAFDGRPRCIGGELLFPKRKGRLVSLPETCPFEWVLNYRTYCEVGEVMSAPVEFANRIADLNPVVASTEAEFLEYRDVAVEWFNEQFVFEAEES